MLPVPAAPRPPVPAHPEEMKAEFDLRIGRLVALQGSARLTPADLICGGIAASAVLLSVGVLVRACRR